jgi:protein tyrosine phosphatase
MTPGQMYPQLLEQSVFGGEDDEWEDAVQTLNTHIADGFVDMEWRAIEQQPERGPQFIIESQQPYNSGKNRYTDVVPYDDTRVTLRPVVKRETMKQVEGSDYFNANWVKLLGSTFMATHAPPPATFPDWYRLVG